MTIPYPYLRLFLAAICFTIVLAAWFGTVQHLSSLVWNSELYSHGVWVPIVSAWLIWRRREAFCKQTFNFSWLGPIGVGAVTIVWLLGQAVEARLLEHLALVGSFNFLILGIFGWRAYRAIIFPMLFLFTTVPLGEQLVEPLQIFTAKLVIAWLDVTGITFEADGVLIRMSSGLYHVARACAGVKFFYTSIVMGLLLCHILFSDLRRRLWMMLFAAIIPIFANAVRVYGILILAEATDANFAKGIDHIVYGWGFLSLILIILIAVAYRFSDRSAHLSEQYLSEKVQEDVSPSLQVSQILAISLSVLSLVAIRLGFPVTSQGKIACEFEPFELVGCESCGFRKLNPKIISTWLNHGTADAYKSWYFRKGVEPVMGLTLLYAPDRQEARLTSPFTFHLDNGWEILDGQAATSVQVGSWSFREYVIWRNGQRRLVWESYDVDGVSYQKSFQAKLALAWKKLGGKAAIGQRIFVSTEMSSTIQISRAILISFFENLSPDLFVWSIDRKADGRDLCVE